MDLNWCPCGRRCQEGSLYCSDTCYMKELACNNRQKCGGNAFEKDDTYFMPYNEKKNNSNNNYLKDPEYESLLFKTANNLAFKNRHEYSYPSMSSYYSNNHHHHQHHHHYHKSHHHNHTKDMVNSFDSNTSTIDDYFKKQTFSSNSKSPKQSVIAIPPKESENAKDNKSEVKSVDSRSSYVIEAVYPVQNFSTIAVY